MAILKGADMSKWQSLTALTDAIEKDKIEFVICKATEGRTYKDPTFEQKINLALNKNVLIGAYHFCRPDNGNTPEAEAVNFVNAVRPWLGRIMLAADWEGSSCSVDKNGEWVKKWCDTVYAMAGVKPLVYCSQSRVKQLKAFEGCDYGLWVAKWSNTPPTKIMPWNFYAVWQYTNKPYDGDCFNGSRSQFLAYCKQGNKVNNDEGSCHCGCHYCCGNNEV